MTYWRGHAATLYPGIAKSALQYLPVSATEVPSERILSTSGNTATSQQESLKTSHVEQLVFLRDNLQFFLTLCVFRAQGHVQVLFSVQCSCSFT